MTEIRDSWPKEKSFGVSCMKGSRGRIWVDILYGVKHIKLPLFKHKCMCVEVKPILKSFYSSLLQVHLLYLSYRNSDKRETVKQKQIQKTVQLLSGFLAATKVPWNLNAGGAMVYYNCFLFHMELSDHNLLQEAEILWLNRQKGKKKQFPGIREAGQLLL